MLGKLPLLRIFLATIVGVTVMAGLFFGLLYYRMRQLYNVDFSSCQGLLEPMLSNCISQITYGFVTNTYWTAITFCILITAAIFLGFFTGKKSHALVVSPLVGFICGILLLNAVSSGGRIIAIATIFGFSLGGLIVHRIQK